MVVLGTRPEAIKLAPVILALQNDKRYTPCIVSTGQHREMLHPILSWFNITPHHTLDVMTPGQPLAFLSGKLLHGLHTLVEAERPEIMMVQGDTTTAFLAALTAYYGYDYYVRSERGERRFIQVAHVEAGLRTYNNYAPFPEEINRRLISPLASFHFAPTATAAEALIDENITNNVYVTGNTVIDAMHLTVERLAELEKAGTPRPLPEALPAHILEKPFILITGHRRESYGAGFQHICRAIQTLAKAHPHFNFLYPVHLNRHVQDPVHEMLDGISNVHLIPPLDYPDFINLLRRCYLVLTDSGGLQEEAPALGKPVLVMRELTERPEGILAGTARVVGTTEKKIVASVSELINTPAAYEKMARAVNPYGDGTSTSRILNLLAGGDVDANTFHPVKAQAA
jgi:UDP-N-acetylglucosamine 2-epimerase (non-hydrolysing)